MHHGFRHRWHDRERFGLWRAPRQSLQRRLFAWFGITIVVTGLVVGAVFGVLGPGATHWRQDLEAARDLVGTEFGRVWQDGPARHGLAARLGRVLDADITLEDERGRVLDRIGRVCRNSPYSVAVSDGARLVGYVRGCPHRHPHNPAVLFVALIAAGGTLWFASAWIARRLTRPLAELVRVTRDIGSGRLKARVSLNRDRPGEVGVLGDAVNDMAERIEKQIRDQRELLAAVSHEIRSPLARLRVLAELAGVEKSRAHALGEIEREIAEIDDLVGKLLASSRLEFDALNPKLVVAGQAALRALEAAQLPAERLSDASNGATLDADPTLLGRALANLLENATSHGRGVAQMLVREESTPRGRSIVFEVSDRGPGFDPKDLPHVFEPFYRSGNRGHGTLGLGLSLVERIARAHGGTAFAENRAEGGARAGIRMPG